MGLAQATITENRALPRDEVHYRARASGPDMRPVTLLIVNMSALGLMARCDVEFVPGDRIRVVLPVIGTLFAEVRWWLGGRVGCELERPIPLAVYYEVLAALFKAR